MSKDNKALDKQQKDDDFKADNSERFDSFPFFYCQHLKSQWNCNYYKVVDKDYYSIATKCRYLGIDGETCNSKSCNAAACRKVLNGS